MPLKTLLLILFSVSLSGLAQGALKAGVSSAPFRGALAARSAETIAPALMNPGVIGGLALYGVGALTWLIVLSRTDLSVAYPFVALSFIVTSAMGWFVFHEALSPARLMGLALIVLGVLVCSRG
jgi:multidrug transporter EmrE-like cation transporter